VATGFSWGTGETKIRNGVNWIVPEAVAVPPFLRV